MQAKVTHVIPAVLKKHERALLDDWMQAQLSATTFRKDLIDEDELRKQSKEFLGLFGQAVQSGMAADVHGSREWAPVREFLADVSRKRGMQGFSPSETATFILSFKQPLFARMREELESVAFADAYWDANLLLDKLGLYTMEMYLKAREEIIKRQQDEMLELSTPVVTLWQGILALPMIGTLDSARTQVVMETLLQRIVETGSEIAIIDITGVPTVDTLVAQHLLKTVAAARLMGADCIISGIRPQIAQTMVHLAIDLTSVVTKASLADAFVYALRRLRQTSDPREASGTPGPDSTRLAGLAPRPDRR
jgi:rsbT co-antagonist protein RsbR